MTLRSDSIRDLLVPYPHLRHALGYQWIREQDQVDPVESPFALARWLRIEGFEEDLASLDAVLEKQKNVPGIADRRKRLRANPLALMETLTELYFGAWLMSKGVVFKLPKKGADFFVHLETGQALPIEVTTPRIALWSQELFERLHIVALRTGRSATIKHYLEELPGPDRWEDVVARVVEQAQKKLVAIQATDRGSVPIVTQDYPQFGLSIAWTPSEQPDIRAVTSPDGLTPYSVFRRIASAARVKACQLPPGDAGALLVGTQNLPVHQFWSFENALRGYSPDSEAMGSTWAMVPSQVKYLIFYSLDLKRIEPFSAMWVTNPASSLPDPPGAIEFLKALFPYPLRSDQKSDAFNG